MPMSTYNQPMTGIPRIDAHRAVAAINYAVRHADTSDPQVLQQLAELIAEKLDELNTALAAMAAKAA